MCRCSRCVGRRLTLRLQKEYGVSPNAVVYSTAISACSRQATADPDQYKTALSLLAEVEKKNLDMSVVGYNAALGACSKAGKWQAAIDLLANMEERGLVDAVSYGTVMAACENGDQWNLVLQYADVMISKGFPLDGLAVTSALHACQQKGLADDALRYLEILKTSPKTSLRKTAGWQRMGARAPLEGPDSVAYRLAISACARGGDWKKGIELLGEMRQVTGKVDVTAYTSAITGCEYAGEWRKAFKILEMMRKDGVDPNEVTMAAIIGACATACARGWDVGVALKKALQLFRVMRKDPTVVDPNIAVYNAAIRACAEANKPDLAFKLLEDAEKQGLEPTIVTFGTLMTACERASSLEGMDRVFQLMNAAPIQPNEIVYGAAISCLRKTSQAERAVQMLQKMVRDDLKPNVATFNTVLITQTESRTMSLDNVLKAYKLMAASESAKPNRQTYGILVRAFCSNQQPQGAEAIIRRMRENGITPDVDLYTLTVSAYEKARQPLRAVRLMESMEQDGFDFYSVKVLDTAFKNAVKIVNVVGKSLTENEDEEKWNELI
jgi:pentatricopeptide repeat domain-containing protein 1